MYVWMIFLFFPLFFSSVPLIDVCRQKQNLEKQERRTVALCGDRFLAMSIKKR